MHVHRPEPICTLRFFFSLSLLAMARDVREHALNICAFWWNEYTTISISMKPFRNNNTFGWMWKHACYINLQWNVKNVLVGNSLKIQSEIDKCLILATFNVGSFTSAALALALRKRFGSFQYKGIDFKYTNNQNMTLATPLIDRKVTMKYEILKL